MTRRGRKFNRKRVLATFLAGMMVVQQASTMGVFAAITAGSGGAGINTSGGVTTLTPKHWAGNNGVSHYSDFNLGNGQTANLDFSDSRFGSNGAFYNLVDSQIVINGILNSVKNGSFYKDGRAIFISPSGMLVGPTGVINVGSLSVHTPTNNAYTGATRNMTEQTFLDNATAVDNNGGAPVTIDGKVFAANDVFIQSGKVTVSNGAGVFAGVSPSEITKIYNGTNTADALFSSLVNTANLSTGSTFSNTNGSIQILSNQEASVAGGIDIAGTVRNFGQGDTKIYNNTSGGLKISGTVANTNGKLEIASDQGGLNIARGAKIKNNGTTVVKNFPQYEDNAPKTVDGKTYTYTRDTNSGLVIAGDIDTTGNLTLLNTGDEGMQISGNVNHSGSLNITNGTTEATITDSERHGGDYTEVSSAKEVNARMAGLNITGNITNTNGTTTITNLANGGMTTGGTITNTGTLNVYNEAGNMTIGGSFNNTGAATFENKGAGEFSSGGANFAVNGSVTNSNGKLTMTQNGSGAFTTGLDSHINAAGLAMTNNGSGFTMNGEVVNNGQGDYINNKGNFNICGTIENNGIGNYTNNTNAGNFTVSTTKLANNGAANFTNYAAGTMTFSGTVENTGTTTVTNSANSGLLTVGGNFTNTGVTNMTNNGAGFDVTGKVTNNGDKLTMVNNKGAFNAKAGSNINAKNNLDIANKGAGGLTTAGTITNVGTANIYNEAGNMTIGGTFTNTGAATFENKAGANNFTVNGTVNNSEGLLTMTNNGTGAFTTDRNSHINANGLAMTNNGSGFTLNGEVLNHGQGDYVNNKGDFNINANITNAGNGNYTNNANAGNFNIGGTVKNTKDNANFTNNSKGTMTFSGNVENAGTTTVTNSAQAGLLTVGGTFKNTGVTNMTNNGAGFDVTGNVTNVNGKLTMLNNKGAFNAKAGSNINANGIEITNKGAGGLTTAGTITNNGTATVNNEAGNMTIGGNFTNTGAANFENKASAAKFDVNGTVTNSNGKLTMTNNGTGAFTVAGNVTANKDLDMTNNGAGLAINGTVDSTGTTNIKNTNGDLTVNGTITHRKGKLSLLNTNKNGGLYVYKTGKVQNENNNTLISNNGAKGLNIAGTVENGGILDITNEGAGEINVSGTVHSVGDINMTNTGAKGIKVTSTGKVNGDKDIFITNTIADSEEGAINVQGNVYAKNNVGINSTNADVRIGHANTTNNIKADKDINITVADGSILNNGVEKVLIKAGGNLTMDVTNGTIGEEVRQTGVTESTGIGPKAQGARDFTKSINAQVNGKVKATTTDAAKTGNDLVINYAAIDSNMNIDSIKADGRVILTVDDDYGNTNTGKRYNMVNASTDSKNVNVEGRGISLIANGNIGSKDNKLTFVQRDAEHQKMDALANDSIYLKENSFNAYGRDGEVTKNSVSTMIAREGDMYVEFAGDTTIDNITAEGDMTVITRGKNLTIENLGHIEDKNVTPADYFGPRHDGYAFDGRYDGDDYKSEVLPNNVTVKALDINHNIRPTEELVDGKHEAWANSTVRIKNAVVDNGKLEITADNVYANGIYAGFNKSGFTKKEDNSTNKVKGINDPASLGYPVGKAVRPDDVTGIGRDENERNYYYPKGDGDIKIEGIPSVVDPDDGNVDATPLVIVKNEGGDPYVPPVTPPGPGPGPGPGPQPEPDTPTIDNPDGKVTWKKVDDTDVEAIDKRQYMRFGIASNEHPVMLEKTNNGIDELLDVSRGGIAVAHSNKLKVGDVVPVHLTYADLDIKADVKVVTASSTRAGASFVNLDKATANKLLYLNILLEGNDSLSFR
ncbi:MAG: leukotoxin LktA family filamentous adhesin [Muribaculaceae bacterium]|nr:leukotoxin LktA family filamentous adhesin [Muribaculaceae bacterium]